MNQEILFLFTRTPLHVGAGNSVGVVDSPIMRERHTDIPIIPGSSLKGVLADFWLENGKRSEEGVKLFGSEDKADTLSSGSLLIGEARVLAFPVRSARNTFAWVTCPFALDKYTREAGLESYSLPDLENGECLASPELALKEQQLLLLEEYQFIRKGDIPTGVLGDLKDFLDDSVWQSLGTRLAIVSDEMFSYFVRETCSVVTRVRIDNETNVVAKGALFNQEQVPSETLFYAVLGEQKINGTGNDSLKKLIDKIQKEKVLQIGADATIGLGFCSIAFKEVNA